jgi:3-oxoacyl-[acyl-carrier protein] reductase
LEESGNGVIATVVCLGYVATDMSAHRYDDIDPSSMLPAPDVAELVVALSHLSALAVVPSIVVSLTEQAIWHT